MAGSDVQELGRWLRETRETKGATLADAQQATKIRLSFLQALEREDYGLLPPPFYIRGFIKTYATFLGLDPRQAVQLFDELLENESVAQVQPYKATPSADSGGQNPALRLAGLSQAEARLVEASNEKLNLSALPAPTLPGYLSGYSNSAASADSSGESRALVPVNQYENRLPQKYVLKPVMLPTTKGAFYMPNFVPTVLVIIIVLAAGLLVYRGVSSAREAEKVAAQATATANAYNNPSVDGSPTPALTPAPFGSLPAFNAGNTATTQASSGGLMSPPPFYTPEIPATTSVDKAAVTALAGNAVFPTFNPLPTPTPIPATATPIPPSPTPIPDPITVEVTVGTSDAKGSWLGITVDGQEKVAKPAQPGEVFTFQGRKIAVRAGNPGVITIKVNGETREYTHAGTGVITHTWYADGKDTIE